MITDNVAPDKLRQHIEAVERLDSERQGISDDIKDRLMLAKGEGFCTKTIRAIVRLRKLEKHDRQEAEALLDTYKAALGIE